MNQNQIKIKEEASAVKSKDELGNSKLKNNKAVQNKTVQSDNTGAVKQILDRLAKFSKENENKGQVKSILINSKEVSKFNKETWKLY